MTTHSYPKSMALAERLMRLTPDASHTLSKAWYRFPWGAYPPILMRGEGVRVWDADGHEFIDLICALGASTLGYHDWPRPAWVASMSLPTTYQLEVAEFITQTFKAEAVRFLTTGSDACSFAVRAARAYTGRNNVLVADNGYHGTHDWFTALRDAHPGVPNWAEDTVDAFRFNDLEHLELCLDEDYPALVMLEPCLFTPPASGFLSGVISLAHRSGALVCFDETILGGRMHLLGGSGYFDLKPDLRVYGKALAAGEAAAFVVGPLDVLAAGKGYSGTFLANGTGLAGLRYGVGRYLAEPELIKRQWSFGNCIQAALSMREGVKVDGYPWHPRLTFTGPDERRLMSVFLQEAADRGVLWCDAGVNVPATMTDADRDQVCAALSDAMDATLAGAPLRGKLIERGIQIRGRAA